jgi:hypothetical protein
MLSRDSCVDSYARPPDIVEVRLLDQGVFYSLGMPGEQLIVQRLALFPHLEYPRRRRYLLKAGDNERTRRGNFQQ